MYCKIGLLCHLLFYLHLNTLLSLWIITLYVLSMVSFKNKIYALSELFSWLPLSCGTYFWVTSPMRHSQFLCFDKEWKTIIRNKYGFCMHLAFYVALIIWTWVGDEYLWCVPIHCYNKYSDGKQLIPGAMQNLMTHGWMTFSSLGYLCWYCHGLWAEWLGCDSL